ncbi:hypothetical protein GCM10020256_26110 [Streptomyces thermocoprophilus]
MPPTLVGAAHLLFADRENGVPSQEAVRRTVEAVVGGRSWWGSRAGGPPGRGIRGDPGCPPESARSNQAPAPLNNVMTASGPVLTVAPMPRRRLQRPSKL